MYRGTPPTITFTFDEAIDIVPCRYTYAETDKPMEKEEAIYGN